MQKNRIASFSGKETPMEPHTHVISRMVRDYGRVTAELGIDDFLNSSWYLALQPLWELVECSATDVALQQKIATFVDWALGQDENLRTAVTIEMLGPLLYGQGGEGAKVFELQLGPLALSYLVKNRGHRT